MNPEDTNLPQMADDGVSEQLQQYNETIQEQAFLLGFRNGYREGEMLQEVLQWVRSQQADPDISQERLDTLRDVEHHLASSGAWIPEEEEEVTHPPGLNTYIGAGHGRPHIQVAGQRLGVEDLEITWEPAPNDTADRYEGFEPQAERGEITIEATVELPEDSEERAELMQFLERLR